MPFGLFYETPMLKIATIDSEAMNIASSSGFCFGPFAPHSMAPREKACMLCFWTCNPRRKVK